MGVVICTKRNDIYLVRGLWLGRDLPVHGGIALRAWRRSISCTGTVALSFPLSKACIKRTVNRLLSLRRVEYIYPGRAYRPQVTIRTWSHKYFSVYQIKSPNISRRKL
jgi:hypothetical protein